jgi:GTP cyclohydrolase I
MYQNQNSLPDVTSQITDHDSPTLKWVGMEKIGIPVQVALANGTVVATSATVDIFVSLDTAAKGIHMSRLYLALNEYVANQVITSERLNTLLSSVLESHKGISESAKIKLAFDLPLAKKALLSSNYGYQSYPVELTQRRHQDQSTTQLDVTIPYSSTCPCSASLTNQLNAQALDEQFPDDSLSKQEVIEWLRSKQTALATPHNQRSYAYIKMDLDKSYWPDMDAFIFQLEDAIGTPVQTAVKREDEQEFARLNGSNLMFCEDAARKLKLHLNTLDFVSDYWFKIEHQESLHAHNAVAIDSKY